MTERWLILAHEGTNTGAPRMLLETLRGVKALRGAEWQCEIIMRRGGELVPEFQRLGRVHVLSHAFAESRTFFGGVFRKFIDRPWIQPRQLKKWVEQLHGSKFDLVYNNTATNEYLVPTVRQFGCPILTHVHELGEVLLQFTGERGLRQTLENTDRFLAVSKAVADDLKDLGIPEKLITLAPNFLRVLPTLPDANARSVLRDKLNLPADAFVVAGCGYVHWLKGTDLFVEVAAALSKLTPRKIIFVWLGGAPHAGFARKAGRLVIQRKLKDVVRFVGPVRDSGPWFAACDVVALTSRMESFSLVALEAGAAAKPVVGFAEARGPAEFIGSEPGLLIHGMKPEAMAGEIFALMQNPENADALGQRLRQKVKAEYLADSRIKAILASVDELKQNWKTKP